MAGHLDRIGQEVRDYRLLRWLGGGGFGDVYLAEQVRDHVQVAVKLLPIRLTRGEELKAFINEARTIRLKHPYIVPLLDFGLSKEEIPFLVMEYAAQGTLRDRYPKGVQMPLAIARNYVRQVASALQYAHEQRLVHRDVKPENMLLRADGTLLLSDFGIASVAHSSHSRSLDQRIGGTIPYMAPEQIQGQARPASDQYSLGVVIYEWLAGRRPFEGTATEVAMQHLMKPPPPLVAHAPMLSKAVEQVVFIALAKNPTDRFTSMHAFAEAFEQASRDLSALPFLPVREEWVGEPNISVAPFVAQPLSIQPSPGTEIPLADRPETSFITPQPRLKEALPPMFSPSHSPTPPISQANADVFPPVHHQRLLTRRIVLLGGLGLTLGSGALTYFILHSSGSSLSPLDRAHTATAGAIQAIDNYNKWVATNGIMLGFDAQHTHTNPYEQILGTDTVAGLVPAWASPIEGQAFSSPVMANGVVYVCSDGGKLYAFDAASGNQKWVSPPLAQTDAPSSPAVANGLVYICSQYKLYAFDAASGNQKWTSSPESAGANITPSPTVVNGVVYVSSYNMYAFDAISGNQKWASPTGSAFEFGHAATVVNGTVYAGSFNRELYAFDSASGNQKWVSSTNEYFGGPPVVVNEVVYANSLQDKLYAFDAASGNQKWVSSPAAHIGYQAPAVANGVVYIASDGDPKLYAFDAASGKQKWVSPPLGGAISSAPTVANGVIYVGSETGKLYAFDATSGKQKWVSPLLGGAISSAPAIANGVIYVGSNIGKLYAFHLPRTV